MNLEQYKITAEEIKNLQTVTEKCYGQSNAMGWHKTPFDNVIAAFDKIEEFIDAEGLSDVNDLTLEMNDALCKMNDYLQLREVATKLMLMVSEIAEAMEGARKNLNDDHLKHRKMVEVELADALIRIFDTAGRYGWDVSTALAEKLAYNANRADHQPENRAKKGGKSF